MRHYPLGRVAVRVISSNCRKSNISNGPTLWTGSEGRVKTADPSLPGARLRVITRRSEFAPLPGL